MALFLLVGLCLTTAATPALGLGIGFYYETRCPGSQEFVEKQLLDIAPYTKDLQLAKVAIHPVPYGNAREILTETGRYEYECQHGPEECYLNRVEACGLSFMEEARVDVWAPWVNCVNKSTINVCNLVKVQAHIIKAIEASQQAMTEAERAGTAAAAAVEAAKHGNMGPAAREGAAAAMAAAKAATEAALSSAEVTKAAAAAAAGGEKSWLMCNIDLPHERVLLFQIVICSLSAAGERLQHLMAEQTPPHDYVPWVTVEREHSVLAEEDLRCAICISPAGKEPSLERFCAGKENCDKKEMGEHAQALSSQEKKEKPSPNVFSQDEV